MFFLYLCDRFIHLRLMASCNFFYKNNQKAHESWWIEAAFPTEVSVSNPSIWLSIHPSRFQPVTSICEIVFDYYFNLSGLFSVFLTASFNRHRRFLEVAGSIFSCWSARTLHRKCSMECLREVSSQIQFVSSIFSVLRK